MKFKRLSVIALTLCAILCHVHGKTHDGSSDSQKPCDKKKDNKKDEDKRIKTLRQNVLDIFGLEFRPNPKLFGHLIRNTVSAKKYMYNLYKSSVISDCVQMNTNVSDEVMHDADTVVSFVNTNSLVPRPNASDEAGAMYFDVQSNLFVEKTLASELRIYLDISEKTIRDRRLKIVVYEIIVPKKKYNLLSSLLINATASMWHGIDVLSATRRWKKDSATNNGVLVLCETLKNKVKSLSECGLIDFKDESENKPFLVSFYQSGDEEEILAEQIPAEEETTKEIFKSALRRRRGLRELFPQVGDWEYTDHRGNPIKQRNTNATCSRRPLYIGFKDLGWSDWIMAPEGYPASYCGGECKFATQDNVNASNHALIQTLVNMMLPNTVPPPCCAPVNLEPLQVLFLDEKNNVIMKKYANMIVNDCACQ